MRMTSRLLSVVALLAVAACGGGSSGTTSTPSPTPAAPLPNIQPVSVNSGPDNDFANALYTDVTVCVPGSNDCQTIHDVLVDTGSSGLRLVASAVHISLPRQKDASGAPLAECTQFVATYEWGPLAHADVQMAGETAPSVPIQLIGASGFPHAPKKCASSGLTEEKTVSDVGGNGLLGVGLFRQDCGPGCAAAGASFAGGYYVCPASGCHTSSLAVDKQVQNPIWLFANDNNGMLLQLPAVPPTGVSSVPGTMIFGIGTRSNNALGSASVYTVNGLGEFSTVFRGKTFGASFLDTGSNAYFFSDAKGSGMPTCRDADFFYCPAAETSFTATNHGRNGTSGTVSFSVDSADRLFRTSSFAFDNLGGPNGPFPDDVLDASFDFGMPFFYGRSVFTAIESQSTPAGSGPYFAY
jgi:hypothetical protein